MIYSLTIAGIVLTIGLIRCYVDYRVEKMIDNLIEGVERPEGEK